MLIRLYAFFFICCLGSFYLPDLAAQCTISTTVLPATCLLTDGGIAVQIAGGIPNYAYNWNNGITTGNGSNLSSSSFTIDNLTTGSYALTVTDGGGCTATSNITVLQQATDTTIIVHTTCDATQVGSLQNLLTDVNGCDSMVITNTVFAGSSTNLTIPTCNPAEVGIFTQILTNQFGCDSTVTTVVVFEQNACVAALGDFVWNDLDGDGIQDAGEPGIPGVTVTLTGITGNGNPVTLTTTTNGSGQYLFSGLAPGTYTLTFTTPAGYIATLQAQSGSPIGSSINPLTGMTQTEILFAGEANLTYDAGYFQPAALGDFVWNDLDGDGIQDAGEPGIPGVTVTLTGITGSGNPVTLTTTTNGSGQYLFSGLAPGTYTVTFGTPPGGYLLSPQDQGGNNTLDSDPASGTQQTAPEVLLASENNLTYDAGFYQLASIGDFVWNDLNGNGIQEVAEAGIPGVSVTLTGISGSGTPVALTTTSGPNGEYLFPNLQPGTYRLTFGTPAGYTPTQQDQTGNDLTDSDANPLTGMTPNEVLISGENNSTYDAGFIGIQVNILVTNVSCSSATNGAIDLVVTNGTAPFTYLWSNGVTTEDLNTLSAGTYSVTVMDATGLTITASAVVQQLILQVAVSNLVCLGGNIGTLQLSVTGGTASYNYALTGSNSLNGSSQNSIFTLTDITAGNYNLVITDGSGCTATNTVVMPVSVTPIELTTVVTPVSCFGGTNGAVNLTVTGGTAPYTYLWSDGATTEDVSGMPARIENVTVTDANGCPQTANNTITQPTRLNIQIVVTNATCGAANGSINLTVTGGTAPYTYSWNNSVITEDLNGLVAGTYCITVTDANACTATICATVAQSAGLTLQTVINPESCVGNGSITVNVTGGTPGYSYTWSNGAVIGSGIANGPFTIFGLMEGTYSITVTDGSGCTAVTLATINPSSPITATPTVTYTNCASATVSIQVTDDNGSYLYDWGNGPFAVYQNSGTNYVTITNAEGCIAVAVFTIDLAASGLCGAIEGRVVRDTIENCQTDAEPGLANWIVRAVGVNTYYGLTDSVGNYHIGVEPGTYIVSVVTPNALWEPCPLSPTITLGQSNDTVTAADLLVQKTADCPALTVSIAAGQLRRCFTGFYTVDYCNDGTAPAENAYILVQLDAYLAAQSATIPYTNLGNGQLRFNLGHLDVGECGSFKIYVSVSCNATPGQTHCTEAHIYPDMPCLPNNPLWSGASLQIQSICNADSLHFLIKNVGTGDLGETVNYIVIEDQVMLMQAPVPHLLAGESVEVAFPANGSTWRMEVQQAAFHPGASQPALSVEGCSTGTFTTGFVPQFPTDDANPWLDIDCTVNTGSYDPNDKIGFPIGYGSAHYVRPSTDMEYKIRFQNTGTDTAFTVVVVDTLSAWLDPATFHPGPASHPYRVELYGTGILKFHFENILLPDSNVNEVASHGFLQFRISPRTDAPLETQIENQAQIYFDFNDPVLTNTTFHRLGEQFVTSSLWQPHVSGATITVSPNPFDQQTRLEVKGAATNAPLHLEIIDLQGNKVQEMTSNDTTFLLKKGNWPTGIYLFRISQKGKLVGSGKLMVQ